MNTAQDDMQDIQDGMEHLSDRSMTLIRAFERGDFRTIGKQLARMAELCSLMSVVAARMAERNECGGSA